TGLDPRAGSFEQCASLVSAIDKTVQNADRRVSTENFQQFGCELSAPTDYALWRVAKQLCTQRLHVALGPDGRIDFRVKRRRSKIAEEIDWRRSLDPVIQRNIQIGSSPPDAGTYLVDDIRKLSTRNWKRKASRLIAHSARASRSHKPKSKPTLEK